MAVDPKMIKSADLAKAREIEFTLEFQDGIKKLVEALGVTRKIRKQAGSVLKSYKTTGTLENGAVAEGEVIPLSKYETEPVTWGEITLKKWRKATTAEAIEEKGHSQAVGDTNRKMLRDVQAGIRSDLFTFMATGTGAATGVGLQAALAQTWGQLQVKFEDTSIDSVYFVNPLDIADYLSTAEVEMKTAFGFKYIEDFLGLGTVILNSSVPKGTLYGTAKDNMVMYYIPVNGADLGKSFNFTSDETGYIGIHETPDYDNMTSKTTVVSGIVFMAERLDGIVVGTISAAAAAAAEPAGKK